MIRLPWCGCCPEAITRVLLFSHLGHHIHAHRSHQSRPRPSEDQPFSLICKWLEIVIMVTKLQFCCVTVTSVTCCHAVIDYEINVSPWAMFAHRVHIAASLSRLFVVGAAVVLLVLVLVLCLFV